VNLQVPLFGPESDWRPPNLSELPSWKQAKRVCVDIETCDPDLKKLGPGVRRNGRIVGVAFAIEDGPAHYLPYDHLGGDNLDKNHVLNYLKEQAKHFTGDLVGANINYDLDYLEEAGAHFTPGFFRDVQVAEPLLDELQLSYSLQAIAERHNLPGKDEGLLRNAAQAWGLDPKSEMWKLPARFVGAYGEQDVRLPLQLLRRQERMIDDQDLWDIYNLESRVTPIVLKMRRLGVAIDWDKLAQIEAWSVKEETEMLQRVYHECNVRIKVGDVWKKQVIAQALTAVGVEVPKTPTGQPKVDKNLLSKIDHPVARCLERARKVNKLRTTFAESIKRYSVNGRLHSTFNQIKAQREDGETKGAAYGRMSSSDPNLQQQPSRDDFASMWRSIYIPDGDGLWACEDYSQQEPRLAAHYGEIAGCRGGRDMCHRYRSDPNADNHTIMAQMIAGMAVDWKPSKRERTIAKIIFLGLCYGMGGAKLCHDLGLPTTFTKSNRTGKLIEIAGTEGQALLQNFDQQVPFVKQLSKMCEKVARQRGYIVTLLGRRCRFPQLEDGSYDWCYKALNRLIQGGSADQMKAAMVAVDGAGYAIQLQVHDELDLTVSSLVEAEAIADHMRHCVNLRVPSKVDVEIGPNWGEIK